MKSALRAYLLLTPALLVLGALFLGGFAPSFLQSFGYFPAVGMTEPTLSFYREVFGGREFLPSLLFSLRIAFLSSSGAVVFGTLLALLLLRTGRGEKIEGALAAIPVIVPHTVAVLLVLNLLARTGLLARLLFASGFISSPDGMPSLVFDRGGLGVIAVYLWKGIPFAAAVVYVVLRNMNTRLWESATVLGASRFQAFRYVVLPLLLPSLSSTFVLLFGFSFGAFEVPFLIGPTFPRALPVAAYSAYIHPDPTFRPYSMVMVVVITFIAMLLVYLYSFFLAGEERAS